MTSGSDQTYGKRRVIRASICIVLLWAAGVLSPLITAADTENPQEYYGACWLLAGLLLTLLGFGAWAQIRGYPRTATVSLGVVIALLICCLCFFGFAAYVNSQAFTVRACAPGEADYGYFFDRHCITHPFEDRAFEVVMAATVVDAICALRFVFALASDTGDTPGA